MNNSVQKVKQVAADQLLLQPWVHLKKINVHFSFSSLFYFYFFLLFFRINRCLRCLERPMQCKHDTLCRWLWSFPKHCVVGSADKRLEEWRCYLYVHRITAAAAWELLLQQWYKDVRHVSETRLLRTLIPTPLCGHRYLHFCADTDIRISRQISTSFCRQ